MISIYTLDKKQRVLNCIIRSVSFTKYVSSSVLYSCIEERYPFCRASRCSIVTFMFSRRTLVRINQNIEINGWCVSNAHLKLFVHVQLSWILIISCSLRTILNRVPLETLLRVCACCCISPTKNQIHLQKSEFYVGYVTVLQRSYLVVNLPLNLKDWHKSGLSNNVGTKRSRLICTIVLSY